MDTRIPVVRILNFICYLAPLLWRGIRDKNITKYVSIIRISPFWHLSRDGSNKPNNFYSKLHQIYLLNKIVLVTASVTIKNEIHFNILFEVIALTIKFQVHFINHLKNIPFTRNRCIAKTSIHENSHLLQKHEKTFSWIGKTIDKNKLVIKSYKA